MTVNEESFYTLEGANGVVITHLFSTDVSSISLAAWNEISEGMTCMSAQAIADFKSELEKLCSEAPCNQQDVATVKSAFARIQNHAPPH